MVSLRNSDRQARLQWAREHQCWSKSEWATVLFCGEIVFNLSAEGELQLIKRRSERNRRRSRVVASTDAFGRRNVLVWGGISKGGRVDLKFINGELTADKYVNDILRPIVLPYAGSIGPEIFSLQDDNSWPHQTRVVNEFLEQEGIDRMEWPDKSPDFSPIETLWDEIAIRVAMRLNAGSSLNEMRDIIRDEWDSLPQQLIDNLVDSMRKRITECINANGGPAL